MSAPLWVKSPQQLAAQAQPPPRSVLTAPVENRVLRDVLVVRGHVRPGRAVEVTPEGNAAGPGIVTATKASKGDRVGSGQVVAEIGGRPLIVLAGTTPAFRDLEPGMAGKDVRQLQVALAELGFNPGERDGVFGAGTKHALTSYYKSLGYEALAVGSDSQVAALRRQVTGAQRQVADARDAVEALSTDPTATDEQKDAAAKMLTRAEEDLVAIRAELAEFERTTGPMLPLGEYAFLPSLPAVVVESNALLGSRVAAPLITFATGSPVVTATLTEAQRALCKPGAPVTVTGDGGLSASGTVSTIGDRAAAPPGPSGPPGPAAPDAAVEGYPLTIAAAAALGAELVGQGVLLTIEVATTAAEQLVVPISAIYADGDGHVYVMKLTSNGAEVKVRVQPGLSAQGYVAVAVPSGELMTGDLVTVGSHDLRNG